MKKLNLNNAIATTAMQTKTNTAMKNGMLWTDETAIAKKNNEITYKRNVSILWRLITAILVGCFLGNIENSWGAVDSGDKPYYTGGQWYSLYYWDTEKTAGALILLEDNDFFTHQVFSPCQSTVYYYAKNEGVFKIGTGQAYLDIKSSTDGSTFNNFVNARDFNDNSYNEYNDNDVPQDITHIKFVRHGQIGNTREFYIKNIKIQLKEHIRLYEDGTTSGVGTTAYSKDFGTITIGSYGYVEVNMRSFLTSSNDGNLTISKTNGDADIFRLDNTKGKMSKTINAGANMCGVWGGVTSGKNTNNDAYKIKIWFYPTDETPQTVTYTISNGTNSATITIKGKGQEPSMNFADTYVNQTSTSQPFSIAYLLPTADITAPAHFQVSADGNTWGPSLSNHSGQFYVRFAPTAASADEETKTGVVTMTSNGTTYNLNVSGKAKKQQTSISWVVSQQDLVLPLNSMDSLNATFLGDPVTDYSTSDNSVIDIVQNDGTYYIEAKGAAGQSAVITASADGTDVYTKPADVSYTFTISPKTVQYIKWNQDLSNLKMASATTHLSVTLTAISCDKGSDEENVNTVTYSYSTDGTNFTGISGSTMTFSSKGTYYLKAYTAETGDATSGYLSAEMVRTVIVRIAGESCPKFSLTSTNINSGNSHQYDLSGLPGTMSGKLKWNDSGGNSANIHVFIKNQNDNSLWSNEDGWKWWRTGETDISNADMSQVSLIKVTSQQQDFANFKYIEGLTVTQQTYFNQGGAATNTIPFGNVTVGTTPDAQTFLLNFANVPEIEIVPSGDTDQFTVTRTNVSSKNKVGGPDVETVDCNCFGNATYSVTFHPTLLGDKSATYVFKAAIEGATDGYVQFTLTVTGKGTKKSQSLSWDNNHSLFTTSLNALSGTIDLTGAAVSYDGSNPTGLTPTYSLSNVTPAGAVELTDNATKLKINTYGSFVLNANQSGEGSNYEAAQTLTHEAINISRVTPELNWTTTPDNNTEVFQTVTIAAATSDTEGIIGDITYSVTPDNAGSMTGEQLTLSNCVATTISATIAETGTYSAKTITHTFTPAKVTPVLQCSVASLTKTALTDLYFTEMPVTITNSTDIWHDIAVTYSSSDQTIAVLDGDHFSLLKSGTCTITAKVDAGVNNVSSNTIQITLTVDKADQEITWNLSADEQATHYSGDSFTLTATSPANNITYTSSNENIATVSNGVLTFHNAGTVTITAHSDATDVYNAADKDQTFSAALSNFADTYIGQASTSQSIDLSSLEGATELTLSSSNPTVFRAFTNNEAGANTSLDNQLDITGATTVNVKFYPESVGEATGTITISGNNGESIAIPVKGEGLQSSIVFGSDEARIPRGSIQQQTFTFDNYVTGNSGLTIMAKDFGSIFKIQEGTSDFTVTFLPLGSNNITDDIIIHENQFGEDHSHDKVVKVDGYTETLPATIDFGTVDVMSPSNVTASVTLSGFSALEGYKLSCDEITSFSIGGKNIEQDATDGEYQIRFRPVKSGDFIDQDIYIYHVDNPDVHYPLLKVTGHASTVDISSHISWQRTTIRSNIPETGMASVSNTYANYVHIEYEIVSNIGTSIFYGNATQPGSYGLDKEHIYAVGAGQANVKAVIKANNGNDFYGASTTVITAIDSKVQNISYPDDGHFVALNETIQVEVYAYDVDNSMPIDASITMSAADGSKVNIIKGTYDSSTKEQSFSIVGLATGSTSLSVTSDPTDNEYETQTFDNINITVLTSTDNCAGTTCKIAGETYTNETRGNGGSKTYDISGAPVKSIKVKFTYYWDTPILTISDDLGHTYYNESTGISATETTKTIDVDVTSKGFGIVKPSKLTINVAGATSTSGKQTVTLQEVMQQSYFNANSPANMTLDFENVTVDNPSATQNITIDYSALHKNMEFTLSGGTSSQFEIENLNEVKTLINDCKNHGTATIKVKFKPDHVEENIVETLTVKGYYTDATGNGQTQIYNYILKGNSKIKEQVIYWSNKSEYSLIELTNRELALDAYSTENLPITYSMVDDGNGTATYSNGIVTVHKAGTIRVKAEQGGNDKVQPADPQEKDITFNLEPQHVIWEPSDWTGTASDTRIISTKTSTTSRFPLKAKIYNSTGNLIDHDPEYVVTKLTEGCGTDLVKIEKSTEDGLYYVYYNNQGAGRVKITATHKGDDTYSPMTEEQEKSMYLEIQIDNPVVTYNETNLNDLHFGDMVVLTSPTSDINIDKVTEFSYSTGLTSDFTTSAENEYVITSTTENTTTLTAIKPTNGTPIYIRANQIANECFNTEAHSTSVSFNIRQTPVDIEWDNLPNFTTRNQGEIQTINLDTKVKVKDTRHSIYPTDIHNLTYSVAITDKGCNEIMDNNIAYVDGNTLYIVGGTSATVSVTASFDGMTNSNIFGYETISRSATFVINKINPVITLDDLDEIVYLDDNITLSASSVYQTCYSSQYDSKVTFVFEDKDDNIVEITGTSLKALNAGTATITVSQSEDACLINAGQKQEFSITIKTANQDVDWSKNTVSTLKTTATTPSTGGIRLQAEGKHSKYKSISSNTDITYEITSGGEFADLFTSGNDTYLVAKMAGPGTVTVVAKAASSENYEEASSDKTFTIEKDNPSVSWDVAPAGFNYPGSITAKATTTNSDQGANITYSVSPEGAATVTENEDGTITITANYAGGGTNNVTVTAKSVETTNFIQSSATSTQFNIGWADLQLILNEGALPELTSVSIIDLSEVSGFATTNYEEGVTYSYSLVSVDGGAEASISGSILTVKSIGKIKIHVEANNTKANKSDTESTPDIAVGIGTLTFTHHEGTDNRWNNVENWYPHCDRVPDATNFDVLIAGDCFIGKGEEEVTDETTFLSHTVNAACHNLSFADNDNAKLVIGEASILNVKGNLTNSVASKLVLTANYWGQASVVFNSGSPKATIEMYIPEGNSSKTDPKWQYRGICVSDFVPITAVPVVDADGNPIAGETINPWSYVHVFEWDEKENADLTRGCWVNGMRGLDITNGSLQPWKGYCFANMTQAPSSELWLTYTGTLINSSQDITLSYNNNTYTDESNKQVPFANVGNNLITNSYAAPLLISQLGYPNVNCEKGVVLYNAGSHKQWEQGGNAGNQRGQEGQFSTVPKETGAEATDIITIPAGQSFFVQATATNATLTLPYSTTAISISPSTRMYLPGKEMIEPEYNMLKIRVTAKSDSTQDYVALLECETCTRQYDNGYDGKKRFGDNGLPQIYAYNKFGNTAVNADSTLNKQYVGFMAGSDDETYTISFETDKLFGYHSLYLTDRKLNETVDILAGETYQFKGYTVGENMRFQINGITEQEWNNENGEDNDDDDDSNVCDLRVVGNTLYVQGFTTEHYPAAMIELFDMTGNTVWSTPLTSARIYDLPSLPQGIYTIRLGDCHVKLSSLK